MAFFPQSGAPSSDLLDLVHFMLMSSSMRRCGRRGGDVEDLPFAHLLASLSYTLRFGLAASRARPHGCLVSIAVSVHRACFGKIEQDAGEKRERMVDETCSCRQKGSGFCSELRLRFFMA